jgi:predicted nucleic acid-binding protein
MGQQPRQGLIIVYDSAPLFALAVCGQLHLLEKLYDEVLIPKAVYQESTVPGKPYADKIAEWAQGKVVEITDTELFRAIKLALHNGEAEAITLYYGSSKTKVRSVETSFLMDGNYERAEKPRCKGHPPCRR